jgi:hypothetical protein
MRRVVIGVVSDTHGGHKLGLLNPETTLQQEDESGNLVPWVPKLTDVQEYLWSLYMDHIAEVSAFAGGDKLVLIHNGDATQGTKYQDHLVSTRVADQIVIGVQNLRPWFELADVNWARLTKGTSSHVLGEGSSEILITESLRSLYPNADIGVLYHGLLDVDGVEADYAHHGPYPGSRNWLRGNVARYDVRSYMLDELSSGRTPARLLLRGHYHQWIPPESLSLEFMGEVYTTTLVMTPSYCGMGAHGHQATRSAFAQTFGMVAIEIVDGKLGEIRVFKETVDLRTKERLDD